MKKMIEVINDNLRSVVNGIKEHRKDAEKNLTIIKSDIDDKVETASQYKVTVENCRAIITSLENEIAELEHDLGELKEKFGSKNFKEILAAGDKEINNKIVEKRKAIAEQNNTILDITKKAHMLKRELTKLKEKKEAFENDLSKTVILEAYYEKRISAVIDYSIQNPEDLATYKEIDEVDDLNTEEIEDINIDNIIDGQVFNEIDSISSGNELDSESVDKALSLDFNDEETEEEKEDVEEKEDTVIEEEKEVVESPIAEEEPVTPVEEEIEETNVEAPSVDAMINEVSEESSETQESEVESTEVEPTNDIMEEVTEEENPFDKTMNIFLNASLGNQPIDSGLIESGVQEHKQIHSMSEPITVNLDNLDKKDEDSSPEYVFKDNTYSVENLAECGLVEENFDPADLEVLKVQFDRANTLEFIGVLEKHGLTKDKIYNGVRVLLRVTPQDLDQMLTMLDGVSGTGDLDLVFRYLDKVNIGKLEQNIALSDDEGLAELLISTLSEENNADLTNLLGLTEKDVNYIMKNSNDDYRIMVNFPEVVLANYNTLNSYKVDNAVECITRYPHRFIMNPSKFAAILDKYDPADLVRCINKNAAVIDKL